MRNQTLLREYKGIISALSFLANLEACEFYFFKIQLAEALSIAACPRINHI